jgi:hypothetical protein
VSISVLSAFHTPKYRLDPSTRTFHYAGRRFPLHADASSKVALVDERLHLALARVLRNPQFQPPLPGSKRKHIPLSKVDDLTALPGASSSSSSSSFATVLGVLTQPEDGLFCLEDHTNAVALDLSEVGMYLPGLYTEGCIVLVEGEYLPDADAQPGYANPSAAAAAAVSAAAAAAVASSSSYGGGGGRGRPSGAGASSSTFNPASISSAQSGAGGGGGGMATKFTPLTDRLPGVFRVRTVGHPPPECRADTLRAMALVDPLNVFRTPAEFEHARALQDSPDAASAMFVVVSDLHLDSPTVHDGLRRMLAGYRDCGSVPSMFVFMGNFASTPYGQHPGDAAAFRAYFDALAALLEEFSDTVAAHTHFVFVPGPDDPGAGGVLPRAPLPQSIVGRLADNPRIPRVTFTSNPARVRFFTHEVVLFRQELSLRMRRRAIASPVPPPPERLVTDHMARTLLCQGHLCPLPLSAQPVYWENDHALRLHPLPDALVIAEDEDQFTYTYESLETMVINPGSFAKELNFAVYRPAVQTVEQSCVADDEDDGAEEGV